MSFRTTPHPPDSPHQTAQRVLAGHPPAPSSPSVATLGLPWTRLATLRSRLSALPLAHDLVLPYALFLSGLHLAATRPHESGGDLDFQSSTSARDASLLQSHATSSLHDAVAFALEEQAQSLAKSNSRVLGDTAFQCLFMGVAYAQSNHSPATHAWLMKGSFEDNLTRLLHAMGVLAWADRRAGRLIHRIVPHLLPLLSENFGPGMAAVFSPREW